jgi:hypothetical protein
MSEPGPTNRLQQELSTYIQETITAAQQAAQLASEDDPPLEVGDQELRRIIGQYVVDERTLEALRRTIAVFMVGANGWQLALELAQQRYEGDW